MKTIFKRIVALILAMIILNLIIASASVLVNLNIIESLKIFWSLMVGAILFIVLAGAILLLIRYAFDNH